jgi:hypothetical protein
MDQESDLENWARMNGYWHDKPQEYYKSLGYKFYGYGGEAQVYAEGDSLEQETPYLSALGSLWNLGELTTIAACNMDYLPEEAIGAKISASIATGQELAEYW